MEHPQPPPPAPPPPPLSPLTLGQRMKKMNWQTLHNVSEDCFWTNLPCVVEEGDIFDGLQQHFSLPNNDTNKGLAAKSQISLRVLNQNTAQNLLISFHALFKAASHEQIKQHILRCDTSILNSNLIETLIKLLPQHKIEKLHNIDKEGVQLSNVEKFVACLGGIERLIPRLNCMNFKLGFNDLVKDLQPDLKAGTVACEEIITSKKFGKVLNLILSIGNLMNSGNSEATGFNLAILTKLHDIKGTNNEKTLLHFIVETIQRKFPELLNFVDELVHIDKAASLNLDNMNEAVQTIATLSQNLQKELEYGHASKSSEDKFFEVMMPFSLKCRNQVEVLTKMMKDMRSSYTTVGKYFAFEVSQCPMGECFSNIKTFKTQFSKAYKDIDNETEKMACQTQNCEIAKQQKESSVVEAGMFIVHATESFYFMRF